MQKTICLFIVLLIATHTLLFSIKAVAAENAWGVWTNKEQTYVYAFLKNNEFKFWGQKSKWRSDIQTFEYTQGKTDGVWQNQAGMCWLGDKKQQQGNIMIYVEALQCCMMAQFLGNKLVLSEVWKKGNDEYGICENRVLTKTKAMPND